MYDVIQANLVITPRPSTDTAATSIPTHEKSVKTKFLLCSISIHRHPRNTAIPYTAIHFGEQTVVLYRGCLYTMTLRSTLILSCLLRRIPQMAYSLVVFQLNVLCLLRLTGTCVTIDITPNSWSHNILVITASTCSVQNHADKVFSCQYSKGKWNEKNVFLPEVCSSRNYGQWFNFLCLDSLCKYTQGPLSSLTVEFHYFKTPTYMREISVSTIQLVLWPPSSS